MNVTTFFAYVRRAPFGELNRPEFAGDRLV